MNVRVWSRGRSGARRSEAAAGPGPERPDPDGVAVRVTDAEVSYGAIRALQGLTMDVPGGELVALLGANAAGKSTLLRAIAGLMSLQAGCVEVPAGRDIRAFSAHQRVRELGIALVPEGRGVLTRLTVDENLAMGRKIGTLRAGRGVVESARTEEEIFDLFPALGARRKLTADRLSGGEQQMLAIARALLMEPEVLLIDEPSIGLAPVLVKEMFDSLRKLLEARRTTIVLAEQNAELALGIASLAYVVVRGQIVLAGDAADVARDPSLGDAYLSG